MKLALLLPLFLATCHHPAPGGVGSPAAPSNLTLSATPDAASTLLLLGIAVMLLWRMKR